MNNTPDYDLCKSCGDEIIDTINESVFDDGECGTCEYLRYQTQPDLVDILDELLDETFDQDVAFDSELPEDASSLYKRALRLLRRCSINVRRNQSN